MSKTECKTAHDQAGNLITVGDKISYGGAPSVLVVAIKRVGSFSKTMLQCSAAPNPLYPSVWCRAKMCRRVDNTS